MIYFTHDADGGKIEESAGILTYTTMDDALEAAMGQYLLSDIKSTKLVEGTYGDYWLKAYKLHEYDVMEYAIAFAPFHRDELLIDGPGDQPGLPGYSWVTPFPTVWVAEIVLNDDDA